MKFFKNIKSFGELYSYEPDYIKDKKYDTDWIVEKHDKTIFIRFCGSKSFTDFIVDLFFFPRKIEAFDGATFKVHSGFKNAYYSVRNQLLDKLYSLYENNGEKFLIVGHSLGGALAFLAAEDIGWHFKTKCTVITYGMPRACVDEDGIKKILEYCDDNSKFFIYNDDVVPTLPPSYKLPNTTKLGDKKFNFFRGWFDIISLRFNNHVKGYKKDELYKELVFPEI